jgi:hypothetical protein
MKFIDDFEAHYDYDCTYMREMVKSSPEGFDTYTNFIPMGSYNKVLSKDVMWVCKLASTLTEDCGACVQLAIKLALEQGVSVEMAKTVVQSPENLSDDLKLIYKFSQAVALGSDNFSELQKDVANKYSKEELTELALAISSTKVYPTIKRALGHFKSCSLYNYDF